MGGGGGVGSRGVGGGCHGRCEQRRGVGGVQGGCERRIEVFVKIKKKMIFGGSGRGRGGVFRLGGSGRGGGSGWM